MSTDPYWDLRRVLDEALYGAEDDSPTTSFHIYYPHEHQCKIHGRWYHTDPECLERFDAPCPGPENHGQSSEEMIK